MRIRGKLVSFSPTLTNTHLGLPDIFNAIGNEHVVHPSDEQVEEGLSLVCRPRKTRIISPIGVLTLKPLDLNEKATVWSNVVKNRLIRTSHDSFIKRSRVMMLYCLIKGVDITRIWVFMTFMNSKILFKLKKGHEREKNAFLEGKKEISGILTKKFGQTSIFRDI